MHSLLKMLWKNLWKLRNTPHQGRSPSKFRPWVETFEDRLVPATLPTPTPGVVTGLVFFDSNKNNVKDTGEKFLAGINMVLAGKTAQNTNVRVVTRTDANGAYNFFQVQPGTYSLTQGLGKKVITRAQPGNLGGSKTAAGFSNIIMAEGQVAVNYNLAILGISARGVSARQFFAHVADGTPFNNKPGTGQVFADNQVQPGSGQNFGTPAASTLAGVVFNDLDNDGTKDDGEAGLANVQLTLTGIDDSGKSIFLTQATTTEGAYSFTVARPGKYTVQVLNQPSVFRTGQAVVGNLGGLGIRNNLIFGIEVTAGAIGTGYNFAELATVAPVANAAKPVVGAELVVDTIGPSGTNSDGITFDPAIQGTIVGAFPTTKFRAGLDNQPASRFVSILNSLQPGGKFFLNLAQLRRIARGTLAQGNHVLHLQAIDSKGRVSATFDVNFTFDNVVPTKPTLALDTAFDDGAATNDNRTSLATVKLVGTTTANTQVELFQGTSLVPVITTSDATGNFAFDNVALTVAADGSGVNDFSVRARDAAGNLSQLDTFIVRNQAPTANSSKPLADVVVNKNAAATVLDLADNFSDADMGKTIVRLDTNQGDIDIELFDEDAPQTVANFLNYVNSGRYTNTIFHRLVTNFVLQGGGFKMTNSPNSQTAATFTAVANANEPTVENEFAATRSNLAGTLAMAKIDGNPNSATSQFFFNLTNNATDLDTKNGGFTVFGRILTGSDQRLVNTLATTPIQNRSSTNSAFNELPVRNAALTAPINQTNLLIVNSASVLRQTEALTYSLGSNSNPGLVTTSIVNNRLTLSYVANQTGQATITVQVTDKFGGPPLVTSFKVFVNDSTAANTAPTANSTTLTTNEDTAVEVDLRTLVSDAETPNANMTFNVTNGTNGTVSLLPDGHTARFIPTLNFRGGGTFNYSVTDTGNGSSAALTTGPTTVNVTINAVNDAPTASGGSFSTSKNTTLDVDLRALASDVETADDNLIFNVTNGSNGTVALQGDGHTARFTPTPDFTGAADFTYSVTDAGDGSSAASTTGPAAINVTVNS